MITATEQLDRTFAALADPTRRAILHRLAKGDASVQDLAAPFDMSLPAVSKHLRVLESAGLIERSADGKRRPSRLRAAPMQAAAEWIEDYRSFWEQSLDRLDALLVRQQQSKQKKEPKRVRKEP